MESPIPNVPCPSKQPQGPENRRGPKTNQTLPSPTGNQYKGIAKASKSKTKSRNARQCCNCRHVASTEWMNGPLPSRNKCQNYGEYRDRKARKSSPTSAETGEGPGSVIISLRLPEIRNGNSRFPNNGGQVTRPEDEDPNPRPKKKRHFHPRGAKSPESGKYLHWDSDDDRDEAGYKCGRLVGTDADRSKDEAINSMLRARTSQSEESPVEMEKFKAGPEIPPPTQTPSRDYMSSVELRSKTKATKFPNKAGAATVPSIEQTVKDALDTLKREISQEAPEEVIRFHWDILERLRKPQRVLIPPELRQTDACPGPNDMKLGQLNSHSIKVPATSEETMPWKAAEASAEKGHLYGVKRLILTVTNNFAGAEASVERVTVDGTRRLLFRIKNIGSEGTRKKRRVSD